MGETMKSLILWGALLFSFLLTPPQAEATRQTSESFMRCLSNESSAPSHNGMHSCEGTIKVELPVCGGHVTIEASQQLSHQPRFHINTNAVQNCDIIQVGNRDSATSVYEARGSVTPANNDLALLDSDQHLTIRFVDTSASTGSPRNDVLIIEPVRGDFHKRGESAFEVQYINDAEFPR
jgi:hypothetical protein